MNEHELNRMAYFNQFKKDIRGSSEYLIIGIDIGKDKHHGFMGTATGKSLLRRLVFDNTIAGFTKLCTHTEAVRVENGVDFREKLTKIF